MYRQQRRQILYYILIALFALYFLHHFLPGEPSSTDTPSKSLGRPARNSQPTVAFITYELYPVTRWAGGAGVVINGLVMDLLQHGHDVVVLADFDDGALQEWKLHHSHREFRGRLRVFHVPSLLQSSVSAIHIESKSIFLKKTRQFARALQEAYRRVPFDIVECFDYAGACYELLRTRDVYLPADVRIVIRMHGTLQLIDRAEKKEITQFYPPSERSLMYLQEQYGINAADALFVQSRFSVSKLAQNYNLQGKELTIAPAPLNSVLHYVDEAIERVQKERVDREFSENDRVFLIYGRFQLVKGQEDVVHAAIQLLTQHPFSAIRPKFLFVGPDVYDETKGKMASEYLQSLVPPRLQDNFLFRPNPIDRDLLVRYTRQMYAAIFASHFEALNLALHEVARCRLPLLLSTIPAFLEYFETSHQAWFFETSNADSLANLLLRILKPDEETRQRIDGIKEGRFGLEYEDATMPYQTILNRGVDHGHELKRLQLQIDQGELML